MRALTESEGRVIAVLLGGQAANERDRLRRLDLPRSTYHAARRRAYEEGWLRDRYVPDPARFGRPVVTVALIRPYADRAGALTQSWTEDPTSVVVWSGGQATLGVFYHADQRAATAFCQSLAASGVGSPVAALPCDPARSELPVYFDYEGLWVHLTGMDGTVSYPNGLGGPYVENGDKSMPRHLRWAATELVHRPFVAESQGRGGHLVGPFGLPYSQLRVLREGWVGHRVFLDASSLPPYQGRTASQVVWVAGALRSDARPEALFATLTRDCRVFPFLYAVHGGRLLLGALGAGPAPSGVSPEPGSRRPVLPTLQEWLEGIEVVQEPATGLRTLVDHRYDRVLAAKPE